MKILAGTDFSPNATEAVTVARNLARRFNDTVQLVHASEPSLTEGMPDPLWESLLKDLQARMKTEVAQAAAPKGGPKVRGTVEAGSAAEVFRRLGRPGQARLVVVSSVGRVALTRFLLGSTAERVAESAAVPTLVTRNTAPFREWAEGTRPLRLLVAADFTLSSDAALGFAAELAAHGPCEIAAGYVDDPVTDAERLGLEVGERGTAVDPAALETALRRDLEDKVAAVLGGHRVQLVVEPGAKNPAATLIEMAKETRADLLIVGAHQHHGFSRLWHRSTSRALLNDAPMSVACVPLSAPAAYTGEVPPLHRVLVTTDFSPLGNRAVAAACALLPNGGRLRLFHALSARQSPIAGLLRVGGRPTLSPGEHGRLILHARKRLGSLVPPTALKRGVSVEVVVEPAADVAGAILRQADQFGAHVVCLSSHGRTRLAGAVFGSVAEQVVAQSRRPVHLVRLGEA